MPRPKPQRFLANLFKKLQISESGCWEWQGYCDKDGYGTYGINRNTYRVHCLIYSLLHWIPFSSCVLHSCDNPACCNPLHLFLGTQEDNRKDCAQKNRTAFGSRSASAKLNEQQVQEIRSLTGMSQRDIAVRYRIRQSTVWAILHRKIWRRA